ncbi:hypothetical protein LINGRAHAP2_LOCUS1956 [Linum grandiflorum]
MNDAFLMKLVWNILSQPNALWVKVLLSNYTKEGPEGAISIHGCASLRGCVPAHSGRTDFHWEC